MPATRRMRGADWLVALCVAAVWFLPSPWQPDLPVAHEAAQVATTRALVERGTYALPALAGQADAIESLAINEQGRRYTAAAPGAALLAAPLYGIVWHACRSADHTPGERAGAVIARLGGSVVPLLAFLALFAQRSRRELQRASIARLGLAALACGSLLLPHGVVLAGHSTAAAALFASFLLAEDHRVAPAMVRWPVAIGALLGISVLLSYGAALPAGVLWTWGLARSHARPRFVSWSAVGMLLPLLVLAHFHWSAFGSPLTTAYAHRMPLAGAASPVAGAASLTSMDGLASALLSPSQGLFWFMPWTVPVVAALPFAALRPTLRRHTLVPLVLLVVVLGQTAMHAASDTAPGTARLVVLAPFLAWSLQALVAGVADELRAALALLGASALVAVAAGVCVLTAAVLPEVPGGVVNPAAELALFAIRAGYFPHSLLDAIGAGGAFALTVTGAATLVLVVAAAASWEPMTWVERSSLATIALVVAGLGLRTMTLPATPDERRQAHARETMLRGWSPPRSLIAAALAEGALPSDVVEATERGALEDAARDAAAEGFAATAISLFAQARLLGVLETQDTPLAQPTAGTPPGSP